ncbi:hypothetical protein AOLI_G00323540 [Acnodon oligacanthus]
MKDSSSGNYACQGLGAFSCVFSDKQMPRGSEEVFVETHVYRGTEEDEATLKRESVMGVFEEDAVDNDAIPLDLSDGVDVSEEESDFEPEEPGSLIHSLCDDLSARQGLKKSLTCETSELDSNDELKASKKLGKRRPKPIHFYGDTDADSEDESMLRRSGKS